MGSPLPGADAAGWGTFSADGRHAIAAFSDGTGILWDTDPERWKAHACRVAHRNLTAAEWRDFVPERAHRSVCP